MNKSTRFDVTVPLLWEEDDALTRVAKANKVPKAGAMRLGLYRLLQDLEPRTVKALIRIRLGVGSVIKTALSIFSGTPEQQAAATAADIEAMQKAGPKTNGGEKISADTAAEFESDEAFELKPGVVYPPEIQARYPEIFTPTKEAKK